MKTYLLPLILLLSPCVNGQSKKKLSDLEKLSDCIAAHTSFFTFNEERPMGKGWDSLEALFANNQFVGWGEYHNSPKLSLLTAIAMESAGKKGFKTLCVETSPFVASELNRISRTKSPIDTLAKIFQQGYPGIGAFPFFHTKEDGQMLLAAYRHGYHIWGIDQEFQMCFSYAIKRVYQAQSKKIQTKFKAVVDSLLSRWWYPDTGLLDSLKAAVHRDKYRRILEDIKISKEIYRYSDNEARASLMKKNFFAYYKRAKKEKVFFKMGSNHLAKGINLQTNLFDIGNAVYELAQQNETGFANIYIMARYIREKGKVVDDLESEESENPKIFSGLYKKDHWVFVDVRKLRTRLQYDRSLTNDTYALLEKYDYILISPEIREL